MAKLKRFWRGESGPAALLVALVAALTYAPFIARLGFYRDDWYLIWSGRARGAASIVGLFSTDRPFMGLIYSYEYRLLGDAPLNWHLYALALKLLGALAFLWLLRMIWPRRRFATLAAALLFVVYPGFLQQPIANTYQNHLFGYAAAILSIALTVRAALSGKRVVQVALTLLSLALAAAYFWIYEYMIGLEGVRLILLWYVLRRQDGKPLRASLRRTALRFLPYLALIAVFLYWRFFLFQSTRPATQAGALLADYLRLPVHMLARLVFETAKDFIETTFYAWAVPPYLLIGGAEYRPLAASALWALAAVGLFGLYVYLFGRGESPDEDEAEDDRTAYDFVWLGALAVLFGLLPMVASGRDVRLASGFDRYTLQATVGVALLVVGLAELLRPRLKLGLLVALIGLSVMTHYHNADYWRSFWERQREIWWQLAWRAPQLQRDTVLVALLPGGYRLEQDYEIWAPVNMIYAPEAESPAVLAEVLNRTTAQRVVFGLEEPADLRDLKLRRDFDNALVLSMPTTVSCLHVVDGEKPELSEDEEPVVYEVAPYSAIERIVADGPSPTPPEAVFGAEPEQGWCYYYQQMSLARQRSEWQRVAELGDEAMATGLEPRERAEWMPYLEALVRLGRETQARKLAAALRTKHDFRISICNQLNQPSAAQAYDDHQFLHEILCEVE